MILFETLAIKNGQILNLSYHQKRYINSLMYLKYLGLKIDDALINLTDVITNIPDTSNSKDIIRCRIDYNGTQKKVQFFEYKPKIIQSFRLINDDTITYNYKYTNRLYLNELYTKRQDCDEVIIIKNGYVSDCTIGNLIFLKNKIWYTPKTPLLKGTQRDYLLNNGKIHLANIKKNDLKNYEKIMMINALNEFDESRALHICQIYP